MEKYPPSGPNHLKYSQQLLGHARVAKERKGHNERIEGVGTGLCKRRKSARIGEHYSEEAELRGTRPLSLGSKLPRCDS